MILRVDPTELAETARPLRDAVHASREVDGLRAELDAVFAGAGSEPVRRATETFLDAWTGGLRAASERAERLVGVLDAAAADYAEVEDRMRRRAVAAAGGGPA